MRLILNWAHFFCAIKCNTHIKMPYIWRAEMHLTCPGAETGRQAILRGWCPMGVRVRIPLWALFDF